LGVWRYEALVTTKILPTSKLSHAGVKELKKLKPTLKSLAKLKNRAYSVLRLDVAMGSLGIKLEPFLNIIPDLFVLAIG
jgi:hypothetical protein